MPKALDLSRILLVEPLLIFFYGQILYDEFMGTSQKNIENRQQSVNRKFLKIYSIIKSDS